MWLISVPPPQCNNACQAISKPNGGNKECACANHLDF